MMKLIKVSDTEIYDIDTAISYRLKHNKKRDISGAEIEDYDLTITSPAGDRDLYYYLPASLTLWEYLEENANNQTWRGKQ